MTIRPLTTHRRGGPFGGHRLGWLLAAGLLLVAALTAAQPAPPSPTGPVTDRTGSLSHAEQDHLRRTLRALETRQGAQIAILILQSTAPEDVAAYALRVAEGWRLGRKGRDDGVLILVATEDRAVRIEVGYGLEGAIPDVEARRVIDETMLPRLREGDLFGALDAAVGRIGRILSATPARARSAPRSDHDLAVLALAPLLLLTPLLGPALRPVLGGLLAALAVGAGTGLLIAYVTGSTVAAFVLGPVAVVVAIAVASTLLRARQAARSPRHGFGGGFAGALDEARGRRRWWGGIGGGGLSGGIGGGWAGGGGTFGGGGATGRW